MRDTSAAKNLLYRRLRLVANHENTVKALEKARAKSKDVAMVGLSRCPSATLVTCRRRDIFIKIIVIIPGRREWENTGWQIGEVVWHCQARWAANWLLQPL